MKALSLTIQKLWTNVKVSEDKKMDKQTDGQMTSQNVYAPNLLMRRHKKINSLFSHKIFKQGTY